MSDVSVKMGLTELMYEHHTFGKDLIKQFTHKNFSQDIPSGNSTFINNNYPINPPTIGVVTFDGLDSMGYAYDINMSNNSGYADELLSQEIDMSNVDTAYLLFFHQPQGHGQDLGARPR